MKLFSANIEDLRTLYLSNLKKALDMEQKIAASLPDLLDAATDSELNAAFRTHLEETGMHASLIQTILNSHTGEYETETCKVASGLTTEAADTIKDVVNPVVRDIALIAAAQQVEHHEIAVYGTLRRWAELLKLPEDARLLKSIEDQEIKTDQLLTQIAAKVNVLAPVAA